MEKLFTSEELCKYYGVSRITLYDWIKKGLLDYIKIGTKYRFTQAHLDEFYKRSKEFK